jgi:transcriptional regulator with XRE-family HTH domain
MELLKTLRIAKGYTQSEVAEIVGIKRNSYGNIEVGVRRPSPEVAKRIGKALDFDWTLFYADPEISEVIAEA